jgi:UDPglucose 6-dehydrogenase
MRITVIGMGYAGLVVASGFTRQGHRVTGIDTPDRVAALQRGEVHIYEPGLDLAGIEFSNMLPEDNQHVVFITVVTPDGSPDQVLEVARWLAPQLKYNTCVVVKSTVPVGTCAAVSEILRQLCPVDASFDVVSNPEFLREGTALQDFKEERVVLGLDSKRARRNLGGLYKRPIVMGVREAEMVKMVANAFLFTKTAFINEVSDLCDILGVNVQEVIKGAASDHRIGFGAFKPGPGIGGSCLPKDTRALACKAQLSGVPLRIVDAAIRSEGVHRGRIIEKIIASGPKVVAVLGLAFKAGTDDTRESPSLSVIDGLLEQGVEVQIHDPHVTVWPLPYRVLGYSTLEGVLEGADTVVVMTDEPEYQDIQTEATIIRLT